MNRRRYTRPRENYMNRLRYTPTRHTYVIRRRYTRTRQNEMNRLRYTRTRQTHFNRHWYTRARETDMIRRRYTRTIQTDMNIRRYMRKRQTSLIEVDTHGRDTGIWIDVDIYEDETDYMNRLRYMRATLACMNWLRYTWTRLIYMWRGKTGRLSQILDRRQGVISQHTLKMSKVGFWRNQSVKSSIFQYFYNRYHEILLKGVIISIWMQAPQKFHS